LEEFLNKFLKLTGYDFYHSCAVDKLLAPCHEAVQS